MYFENYGYCVCCDQESKFIADNSWFRDHYKCSKCNCIPRERALTYCIEKIFQIGRNLPSMNHHPVDEALAINLKQMYKTI